MEAEVKERIRLLTEEQLLGAIREDAVFVVLDGVTDVGNFASILRSCYYLGASGVVARKHRSAPVNRRVLQLSKGAAAHVPVYRVGSLRQTIKNLQQEGVWSVAFDPRGKPLHKIRPLRPAAIVLGDEGKGISKPVLGSVEEVAGIPMCREGALNVAVSCGIALFWLCQSF